MKEEDILDLTIAERIQALYSQYLNQKSDEDTAEEMKVTYLFYRIIVDLPLEKQNIVFKFLNITSCDSAELQILLYESGISDGINIMKHNQKL